MKARILSIALVLLLLSPVSFAQTGLNNQGAIITVINGAHLNVVGAYTTANVQNNGAINVASNSTIEVDGSFTNDNTFTLDGTMILGSNWLNNNSFSANSGSEVIFNGTDFRQQIGGTVPSTFGTLTVNNTNPSGLPQVVDGNNHIIRDSLKLVNGIIDLDGSTLTIQANGGASAGHADSYVDGTIRQYIGAKTYNLPLGVAPSPGVGGQFEKSVLNVRTYSTLSYIDAQFIRTSTPLEDPVELYWQSSYISQFLDYGFWRITPNVVDPSLSYDITLVSEGHSNGHPSNAAAHGVFKRPTPSGSYNEPGANLTWTSTGWHDDNDQSYTATTGVSAKRWFLTGFSDLAIGRSPGPGALPIELLSFEAECAGNAAQITWTSLTETNNDYFTIERSFDGLQYEVLAIVNGAGNSNNIQTYSIVDVDQNDGTVYYKLSQTDYDGQTTELGVQTSSCGQNAAWEGIAIHADQDNHVQLIFSANQNEAISFQLFDARGRLIFSESDKAMDGMNARNYNFHETETGIYFVRFQKGNSVKSKRIILH